jgi:hypothetical protein
MGQEIQIIVCCFQIAFSTRNLLTVRSEICSANPISKTGGIGQGKFQKVMQTYSKF